MPAEPPFVAEFAEFYRSAAPRLVAFLRWQGASFPDAADCAQEALMECFRQWPKLTHHHAWCRIVAARAYARLFAKVSSEKPIERLDAAGQPLLNPSTDLDDLEHRHTMLGILDLLPMRQRQVMAWSYDGASPAEIAEALQISQDTVRANLYQARKTLRARRDQLGLHQ